MSVSRILEEFSKFDSLPIEVSRVLDMIRELGVLDIIEFYQDLDLDTKVLGGFLKRTEIVDGAGIAFKSLITYGKLGHELERIVCCKELIHVLDPIRHRVSSPAQVKDLISKIALPADLVDPIVDGEHVWTDRIATLEAVAILFPLGARNVLYEKYMTERISLAWIAEQAELPVGMVKYAMNGDWPSTVNRLISRRRRAEEEHAPKPSVRKRNRRTRSKATSV